MLATERGNTISHFVENFLWKMLWTCCKTDYRINEGMNYTKEEYTIYNIIYYTILSLEKLNDIIRAEIYNI
jgi:hypothetical protein